MQQRNCDLRIHRGYRTALLSVVITKVGGAYSLKGVRDMGLNVNSLIAAASRKLGIPEEKIRKAVNEGNVDELRSYLGGSDREAVDRAMNDESFARKIQEKYMSGK